MGASDGHDTVIEKRVDRVVFKLVLNVSLSEEGKFAGSLGWQCSSGWLAQLAPFPRLTHVNEDISRLAAHDGALWDSRVCASNPENARALYGEWGNR